MSLAVLGPDCCADSVELWWAGAPLGRSVGALIAGASLAVEHRLWGVQASVLVVHELSPPAAYRLFLDQGSSPALPGGL